MAATGYTPISLYYSTTASAVPTAGNLANGELALNIADMKLYAKNSSGTVTLLASNAGASGSVTSVSGTGTVNGLTLTGTVTTSGSLTLGGTLSLVSPPPIGSSTPNTGAFTTLTASGQINGRSSNGNVFVTSNGSDADFVLSLASGLVTQNVTGSLQLQTGGVNRAVISSTGLAVTGSLSSTTGANFATSSGGVGIGTNSPTTRLDVYQGGASCITRISTNAGNNTMVSFYQGGVYEWTVGQRSNQSFVFNSGGNFAGTDLLTLTTGGSLTATGSITAYSDERLKTDWVDLPDNFIERLATVKSGTYTRIDNGSRQAGSSAQEWQNLLPEVVLTNEDKDKTLSLAYGNAALVSVIELAKRFVALEAEVTALKGTI